MLVSGFLYLATCASSRFDGSHIVFVNRMQLQKLRKIEGKYCALDLLSKTRSFIGINFILKHRFVVETFFLKKNWSPHANNQIMGDKHQKRCRHTTAS